MNQPNPLAKITEIITAAIEKSAAGFGLSGTEALKQTQVTLRGELIEISAPEYVRYIQSGRRAGSLKGVRVPVDVLIRWLKSKGNSGRGVVSQAWAIQTSIFNNGIKTQTKPRPFIEQALTNIDSEVESVVEIDLRQLLDASFVKK